MSKMTLCMVPVLAECPDDKPECIAKQASSLCKCTSAMDQVVAQCPDAEGQVVDLQQSLSTLCSPCGKAILTLGEKREACMKLDSQGNVTGVNSVAACGETCQPLMCSVLSACSAGAMPADGAAEMKGNITAATEKCPCSP